LGISKGEYFAFDSDTSNNDDVVRQVLGILKQSVSVEWNGKPTKIQFASIEKRQGNPYGSVFRQWVYWPVQMSANEQATNKVTYTFPTWNSDGGGHGDAQMAYLKYVLKTGSAWSGPIESALIKIHYREIPQARIDGDGEVPKPSTLSCYPEGYRFNRWTHSVTWKFKNLVPDKDIYFGWMHAPSYEDLDKEQTMIIDDLPLPR
jgi:hypothetical protein